MITAADAPIKTRAKDAVTAAEKLFILPVAFKASFNRISLEYTVGLLPPLKAAALADSVFLGLRSFKIPSVIPSGVSSNTRQIPITAVSADSFISPVLRELAVNITLNVCLFPARSSPFLS